MVWGSAHSEELCPDTWQAVVAVQTEGKSGVVQFFFFFHKGEDSGFPCEMLAFHLCLVCPPISPRSVKFNKGYTALSQSPDENLVSLDSDR